MEQNIAIKGYFFQPGIPNEQLPGFLSYNQDTGINLDLFGQFDFSRDFSERQNSIILGFTVDGKKVTLLNCYESTRQTHIPGFPESKINAAYLFIGEHFEASEDVIFDYCILEYVDFNHWVNINGFSKPELNDEQQEITLKYNLPQRLPFHFKKNWTASIEFSYMGPSDFFIPQNKATIEQYVRLKLFPATQTTFGEFQNTYNTFNSFLAICYFAYPIIASIKFYLSPASKDENEEPFRKVELLFKTGINETEYSPHDSKHAFLLRHKDFGAAFEPKLNKWYALNEKAKSSIDILTECFMKRHNPIEMHFVSLVQGLESFHRRVKRKKKTSLKNRLNDLANLLPEKISRELAANITHFLDRIEINRNYYTHFSEDHETKAGPPNELFLLSEKMKIWLVSLILLEIGFSSREVETIIITKGPWLFNHIIKPKSRTNLHK